MRRRVITDGERERVTGALRMSVWGFVLSTMTYIWYAYDYNHNF